MRSLIDKERFKDAQRELNVWFRTGEDINEHNKLSSYFEKKYANSKIN